MARLESARCKSGRWFLVHRVPVRGKGVTIRETFRRVQADIYLMVDGDGTYPASAARELIQPLIDGETEMVIGNRMAIYHNGDGRRHHQFGNRLIQFLVAYLFKTESYDVLSGYRAFTYRSVKTTSVLCNGFEMESELTLQALDRHLAITEVPIVYSSRSNDSASKLRTFHDGPKNRIDAF